RRTLQARKVAQGFAARQLRIEGDVLRQITQVAAHVGGARVASQYLDTPFAGLQQAENQLHAGGLAGAVMAEQPQYLAFAEVQVQIMQHGHVAVTLADALDLDGIHEWGLCVVFIVSSVTPPVGGFISGWLSCTPGDLITGKARCTQRSTSMLGLFISRRTCGYIQSRRSTLSLGS